jgi:hypothetical protein
MVAIRTFFLYLPLKGGGRRAISAFTRVFDALWRVGWGSTDLPPVLTPTPTLPLSGGGRTCRTATP